LTVIWPTFESERLPESPVMSVVPLIRKTRFGAANLMKPAEGSVTASVSELPVMSVTTIVAPVVTS